MHKLLLLGTVLFAGLAFVGYRAFAAAGADKTPVENAANSKILIAYYSHSGNTKAVAESIQKQIGGDLFEITSADQYPSEYRPMTEQAKKEIAEGYRPELTSKVADMAQYDVVFIGSPIWWGTITPQVSSFLADYDFSGKTVIPFVTHGGGGKSRSFSDMSAQCKGCNFNNNGWSGYGSMTVGLNSWLEDLGFKK